MTDAKTMPRVADSSNMGEDDLDSIKTVLIRTVFIRTVFIKTVFITTVFIRTIFIKTVFPSWFKRKSHPHRHQRCCLQRLQVVSFFVAWTPSRQPQQQP